MTELASRMATFGEIITQLREARGLNKAQLGKKLKVTRAAVGKWEDGKSVPGLTKLIEIAKFFDVSLSLFGDPDHEKGRVDHELATLAPQYAEVLEKSFKHQIADMRRLQNRK